MFIHVVTTAWHVINDGIGIDPHAYTYELPEPRRGTYHVYDMFGSWNVVPRDFQDEKSI